jgi:predicted  nucleic acid-binding Zn-ribbon protein
MASHGLLASALPFLSAAGGLSGLAAIGTLAYKHRESRAAEQQARDQREQRAIDQAQAFTQTALALLDPVKSAAAEAERQVKALQQQVRDLETSVESLTSAMATLAAKDAAERTELEQQLAQVTAQRDDAVARLAVAEAEQDRLLAENTELRRTHPGAA